MKINRREFLILTTTFVANCGAANSANHDTGRTERVINVGPAGNYAADGVYAAFRSQGFFIVRRAEKLFALSATCTHKKCTLKSEPNHSFYCPCHGSSFDPDGHVKSGPAKRDLPLFPILVDEHGQFLVTIPAPS